MWNITELNISTYSVVLPLKTAIEDSLLVTSHLLYQHCQGMASMQLHSIIIHGNSFLHVHCSYLCIRTMLGCNNISPNIPLMYNNVGSCPRHVNMDNRGWNFPLINGGPAQLIIVTVQELCIGKRRWCRHLHKVFV